MLACLLWRATIVMLFNDLPMSNSALGSNRTYASPRDNERPVFLRPIYIAIASVLLVLLPVVVNLRTEGIKSIFGYFAADTFFYLAVAKNSSWLPAFSFDGIYPTNGFHPLWQFLVKALGNWLSLDSKGLIYLAFIFSWICISIAAPLLVLCANSITRRSLLSLASVFPGFVYLISGFANSFYGNIWSFINGMESPLSLVLFAVLLTISVRWNVFSTPIRGHLGQILLCSVLLALITLSRLDDIFLVASFLIGAIGVTPAKDRPSKSLALIAVPVITVAVYMLFNKAYAGSFLPVSGIAKGGLSIKGNIFHAMSLVAPVSSMVSNSWGWWTELAWRSILMNLPGLVGIGFILMRRREVSNLINAFFSKSQLDIDGRFYSINDLALMLSLAVYVVMKWLYNLANVGLWHQGHWYYPVSIFSANILIAYLVSCYMPSFRPTKGGAMLAIAALISFNLYLSYSMDANKASLEYNRHYYSLWSNKDSLTLSIKKIDSNARLVEYDDGIISYSLDVPTMSGLGFALDKEALQAKKEGKLLDLARQRGFEYVTSLNYMPNDIIKAWFLGGEAKKWNFNLFLEDPKSGLRIYRFSRLSLSCQFTPEIALLLAKSMLKAG